jgi:16S rRNA (guanine527-N7)-methyltransferase
VFHVKQGDRDAVLERIEASSAVAARLDALVATLERWAPRLNLVARSTLADVWVRHVEDSAQLVSAVPEDSSAWIDLGSGGGFPGLVVAAMTADRVAPPRLTLVESDARKAAFLRAAAAAMEVQVDIKVSRIEALEADSADVISARALAPLSILLEFSEPFLAPGGVLVFPKGRSWRSELTEAQQAWHMAVEVRPSVTHPDAVVLVLSEIARV